MRPDLSVEGHPERVRAGRLRQHPARRRTALPQLGSVAQQAGTWAARNILGDIDGTGAQPFHYRDKGIMAMIGRKAAVAEVGEHRHELHGRLAFAAWLGRARGAAGQHRRRTQGVRGLGRGVLPAPAPPLGRTAVTGTWWTPHRIAAA